MEKTIDTIMESMEKSVRENMPVSPAMWVDGALKLNALKGDLDNKIAEFESEVIKIEAKYIRDEIPASQAKVLAKADVDYEGLLKAKAKEKRIVEFIRLAKHRSKIEEI